VAPLPQGGLTRRGQRSQFLQIIPQGRISTGKSTNSWSTRAARRKARIPLSGPQGTAQARAAAFARQPLHDEIGTVAQKPSSGLPCPCPTSVADSAFYTWLYRSRHHQPRRTHLIVAWGTRAPPPTRFRHTRCDSFEATPPAFATSYNGSELASNRSPRRERPTLGACRKSCHAIRACASWIAVYEKSAQIRIVLSAPSGRYLSGLEAVGGKAARRTRDDQR